MACQLIALVAGPLPQAFVSEYFDAEWAESLRLMFDVFDGSGCLLAPEAVVATFAGDGFDMMAVDLDVTQDDLVPGLKAAISHLVKARRAVGHDTYVVVDGTKPVWGNNLLQYVDGKQNSLLVSVQEERDFLAQFETGRELVEFQYLVMKDKAKSEEIGSRYADLLERFGWGGIPEVSVPFDYALDNVYGVDLHDAFVLDRWDDLPLVPCVNEDILDCLPENTMLQGMLYSQSGGKCRWVSAPAGGPASMTLPAGFPSEQAAGIVDPETRQLCIWGRLLEAGQTISIVPVFDDGVDESMAKSVRCSDADREMDIEGFVSIGVELPESALGLMFGIHREGCGQVDFMAMQEAPNNEWHLNKSQMKRYLPEESVELSARQQFPSFCIPDHLLISGTLSDLERAPLLFAEGRIEGLLRELEEAQELRLRMFRLRHALLNRECAHV